MAADTKTRASTLAQKLEAEVEKGVQKAEATVARFEGAARSALEAHAPPAPAEAAPAPDTHYSYDYDFIAPIAMLDGVPLRNLPDLEWMVQVGIVAGHVVLNSWKVHDAFGDARARLSSLAGDHPLAGALPRGTETSDAEMEAGMRASLALRGRAGAGSWLKEVLDALIAAVPDMGPAGQGDVGGLDAYDKLFQALPLPAIAQTFQEDASFAELRVAGPNPTSLFRVTAPAGLLPVTEEQFQAVVAGDTLAQALADGRLYMVDYQGQQPIMNGTCPEWQKYAFEPRALFAVPPGGGKLVPVAVQCGRETGRDQVYTPRDGDAWLLARTVVQVADGNFHELVAHLGRTHLTIEPFTVATERTLPASHPLRALLDPHFEGTLFINWAAGAFLTAPKNFVDMLLSGTIEADRTAAVRVTSSRSWADSFLPAWLAAQGLDDREKLPYYPFRDDALLLWEAIGTWTAAFVAAQWPDDAAVRADADLQAWAREIRAFDGGRVAGFGDAPGGGIATAAYLAGALQMIVFTGSAMHAAVNFPQGDIMEYAPAVPLAGYTPAPSGAVSAADWHRFLPPLKQALTQLNILHLLGSVYHTRLGDYPPGQFGSPAVNAALGRFQARLREIEGIITTRNESRDPPYRYLLPSRIPQSINI